MKDALALAAQCVCVLFAEVSATIHPLLGHGVPAAQPCECECPFAPCFCLADLDPHAGHRRQHPGLFSLCLGFRSPVCDLQPTLQPLLDYAGAHAGSRVLLGLCPHHLCGASAQVGCVFRRHQACK